MKFEEGKVYINKQNGRFVHIKEITRFNEPQQRVACIVCSGDCNFKGDSKTTVNRQVFTRTDFESRYKEEKTLCDKLTMITTEKGDDMVVCEEQDVKQFIKDIKEEIKNNSKEPQTDGYFTITWDEAHDIIDKKAGKRLV